jgi:NAD(P)-dependent dehydrogenase (short-subunit alcohol dehydrogenase family)
MTGRLAGKVALIAGTASGQGRPAALLFAAEDATVVGTDVNADGAAETMALVRARDARMDSTHPLDLNDEDGVKAWIDAAASRHGGIDILYNNVGATGFRQFLRHPTPTGPKRSVTSWISSSSPPGRPGRIWLPAAVAACCWSAPPPASPAN